MSFSNRLLLKHWIIDMFLIGLSCFIYRSFMYWGHLSIPNDTLTTEDINTLWTGFFILVGGAFTVPFLIKIVKNFIYHRSIAKSKMGSSLARFKKAPYTGQALDLLKDVLFGLDWMTFSGVNSYLSSISIATVGIYLEDPTWDHRDNLVRPTPQLCLFHHGKLVAKLPIYK